jgi:hypothetical protein
MKKLVLFCFIFAATHVFAQKVATVLSTSNKVVASHNGATRPLSRGSSLEPGDSILTFEGAQANIKYLNGTLVNIGSKSNYKILAYSPKTTDVQIKAELSSGIIFSKTTGKTKETLKTPVAALAILGTKYAVDVTGNRQTYVNVTEGRVKVGDTIFGPGSSILVTPQGITHAPFPQEGILESEYNDLDTEDNGGETAEAETEATGAEEIDGGEAVGSEENIGFEEIAPPETSAEEIVGLLDTTLVVPEINNDDLQVEHGNEIAFE